MKETNDIVSPIVLVEADTSIVISLLVLADVLISAGSLASQVDLFNERSLECQLALMYAGVDHRYEPPDPPARRIGVTSRAARHTRGVGEIAERSEGVGMLWTVVPLNLLRDFLV